MLVSGISLFIVVFILITLTCSVSVVAADLIVKNNQSVQITKGADTFIFELKNVNGSTALLDKTYESATQDGWYVPSDCLVKTERGCHFRLSEVSDSDSVGYIVLIDEDTKEEVTLITELNKLNSNDYVFNEPFNLFQTVNSYDNLLSWCPEEVSSSKIREKINKFENAINIIGITDEEINEMVKECDEKNTFTIKGKEVSLEIIDCVEYLSAFLINNTSANIEYSKEDLLQECEIRNYFKERFNEDIVNNYNESFFNSLFEKRNEEFIEKLIYEHEWHKTNIEENNQSNSNEDDENSIRKIKKDGQTLSGNKKIRDIDEEISILTIKNTASLSPDVNKETIYIDTREMIQKKLLDLENSPVTTNKELESVPMFIALLKKVFGFLPLV